MVPDGVGLFVMPGKKGQTASTRKARERYEPELLYQYWAAAVGNVWQAKRLAAEAGEGNRVPPRDHTWAAYAKEHGFAERLAQEEKDRWTKYHAEREARQQQVLDSVAETFEQMAEVFQKRMLDDFKLMRENAPTDIDRLGAEKRLTKLFGTMDAVDKFFRMYLRARGLPEKISRNINENTDTTLGYGDLEPDKPKAKSPKEAKEMEENSK